MIIREVVQRHPQAMTVFERHGMACSSCLATQFETVRNGAKIHNLDVNLILRELNEAISSC